MIKVMLIALSVAGLCAEEKMPDIIDEPMSAGETIFWYGIVAGGTAATIMCVPMILSVCIILPVKVTIAAAKIIATGTITKSSIAAMVPIAGKINIAVTGVQLVKSFIHVTPKQKLDARLKEEANELLNAKLELENCLMQHKTDIKRNSLGIPTICEDAAMLYALCQHGKIDL